MRTSAQLLLASKPLIGTLRRDKRTHNSGNRFRDLVDAVADTAEPGEVEAVLQALRACHIAAQWPGRLQRWCAGKSIEQVEAVMDQATERLNAIR